MSCGVMEGLTWSELSNSLHRLITLCLYNNIIQGLTSAIYPKMYMYMYYNYKKSILAEITVFEVLFKFFMHKEFQATGSPATKSLAR